MPVHTDTLRPIYVHKPLRIPAGTSSTRIVILDPDGPVNQATVTLTTPDHQLITARSAPDGTATLELTRAIPGNAHLTVTASNHRPLNDSIIIQTDQKITIVNYQFIDSTGDANGFISAGETFTIRFYIKNLSPNPLSSLRARLTTESPLLTVEQDIGLLPVLPPETITPVRLFLVRTSPDAFNGDYGLCTLTITEATGAFTQFPLIVQFSEPVLKITDYYLVPQIPVTDTCALFLKIANTGLAPAPRSTGTVFNPDLNQNLNLITPGLLIPPLPPGETAWSLVPCRFTALTDPIRLGINLVSGRFVFSDTLTIPLQTDRLMNRFDSIPEDWSVTGINGSWYLTAGRFHSPPYSIHAGNADSSYPPNCTCALLSPQLRIPGSATLSFWCSYELSTYGTDGLYCIIIRAGQEETLDFIGAGGALRRNPTSDLPSSKLNDPDWHSGQLPPAGNGEWVKFHYDLSYLTPGAPIRLKFVFVSDPDPETAAGFYLDDIQIQPADSVRTQPPETTRLLTNFPNPFRARTTVFLGLAAPGFVNLSIYSTTGARIRTLIAENKPAGYYSVAWDGTDETGTPVPAGVYFLRLNIDRLPPGRIQRKIIKTKR
jgi:hypothetical protein